jgi:hypothetical protein
MMKPVSYSTQFWGVPHLLLLETTAALLIIMAPTTELLACGVLLLAGSAHAFVAAPVSTTSCQRAPCTMRAAAEGAPVGRRELVHRTAQAAAAVAGVLAAAAPASAELGGFYEKVCSLQTMLAACNALLYSAVGQI